MEKLIALAIFLMLSSSCWAGGLGDTFADFERAYNKGYRQEFPLGAFTDVRVGSSKKRSVAYAKGWNDFAGRVGQITGETWGLFGVIDTALPTTKQFLKGIKSMMPADAKLVAKYASNSGYQKEIYVFKSSTLAKMKGIDKSLAYYQDGKSIGKFFLVVNHNIDDSRYVVNFLLSLGSGESDFLGMKKVKAVM